MMEGVHDELITRINQRPGHSFEATWNGLEAKGRVFHAVARMGPPHDLGVFNSGVDAVGRALLERYFFCKVGDQFEDPLEVVDGAFDQLNLDIFREMTVRSYVDDVEVLAMHDVVKLYNGPKRKLYADALESLRQEKLSKWDADLRPFTKFEKQDLGKAPRIIQPRSPRYNLKLAKFLKKLEKGVYHALNETWGARTSATVIKGSISTNQQKFYEPSGTCLGTPWQSVSMLPSLTRTSVLRRCCMNTRSTRCYSLARRRSKGSCWTDCCGGSVCRRVLHTARTVG